jgi:hypothetical protein
MRTSNPPSYDKITSLYTTNAAAMVDGSSLTNYVLPSHRAIIVVNTSATATITDKIAITNIDGTSGGNLQVAPGMTILPIQIWKMTITQVAGLYVYALR